MPLISEQDLVRARWMAYLVAAVFLIPAQLRADEALTAAAKTPLELERFFETHAVFDTAPLWDQLGVHDDAMPLPQCTEAPETLRACSSELTAIAEPHQAIVALSQLDTSFTIYLRFVQEAEDPEQWQFSGFFEPYVKYFPSTHNLLMFGNHPFFLITGQGVAGMGVSSTLEYWIDLEKPGMRPCFSRTLNGTWKVNGAGSLSADVFSSIVALREKPVERISIVYQVDFRASDVELNVATRKNNIVFTRQTDSTFELDVAQSKITKKELHDLYEDPAALPRDDFLLFNIGDLRNDLVQISELRGWMADYLSRCGNTPEKRELLALLRNYRKSSRSR